MKKNLKEKPIEVKDLLSEDLCTFFSSLTLTKTKTFHSFPGPGGALSHNQHSHLNPIVNHFLDFLQPKLEKILDIKIKPTFGYNRVYFSSSQLEHHTDRESCEIACTITINYYYENKDYKWPLIVGDVPYVIEKGNALLYSGTEIVHWRPLFTQPTNSWHHQLMLFYVYADGKFKDTIREKYDE